MKNRGILLLERTSATLLSLPGRCDRRMVKLGLNVGQMEGIDAMSPTTKSAGAGALPLVWCVATDHESTAR